MNDHFTISIEITARDADDIEHALLRRVAMIDAAMASVKRRHTWAPSVKAATLAEYEHERRTLSALQMNIARAYANAKAGAK